MTVSVCRTICVEGEGCEGGGGSAIVMDEVDGLIRPASIKLCRLTSSLIAIVSDSGDELPLKPCFWCDVLLPACDEVVVSWDLNNMIIRESGKR